MTISTTSFEPIYRGQTANDNTGDTLRDAFLKVNNNFANIEVGFDTANINVEWGITISNVAAPTGNSSATGSVGQIAWDSGNIYVCVAPNTWKRAALSSF